MKLYEKQHYYACSTELLYNSSKKGKFLAFLLNKWGFHNAMTKYSMLSLIAPKQTRNTTKISVSDHFLHIFQDLNSKVKCLLSILVSSRNYCGTLISVQTPFQTGVLAFANKVFCSIGQPVGPSISGQSQSGKSFHGGFLA